METDYFLPHYQAYLQQLRTELMAYPDESSLWKCPAGISNSAGNLTLHLMGNLNHFIGQALGQTGYQRNRPLEFSLQEIPRQELLRWINKTELMLGEVLTNLAHPLPNPYPAGFREDSGSIGRQLALLLGHLAYHLGQINYHRRLLCPPQ